MSTPLTREDQNAFISRSGTVGSSGYPATAIAGWKFKPNKDIVITNFMLNPYYAETYEVHVWDCETQAIIASKLVSCAVAQNWNKSDTLDEPVTCYMNREYLITTRTAPTGRYGETNPVANYYNGFTPSDAVHPDITWLDSRYFVDGVYSTQTFSSSPIMPGIVSFTFRYPLVATNKIKLPCIGDTSPYYAYPNQIWGGNTVLNISGYDSWYQSLYNKFDLVGLAGVNAADIVKAESKFYYYGNQEYAPDYSVRRVLADWDENVMTYNNQAALDTFKYASVAANSVFGWKTHNITQLVKEWQSGTYPNYGLAYKYDTTGYRQNMFIYSKEYYSGNYAPYVEVELSYFTDPYNPTVHLEEGTLIGEVPGRRRMCIFI